MGKASTGESVNYTRQRSQSHLWVPAGDLPEWARKQKGQRDFTLDREVTLKFQRLQLRKLATYSVNYRKKEEITPKAELTNEYLEITIPQGSRVEYLEDVQISLYIANVMNERQRLGQLTLKYVEGRLSAQFTPYRGGTGM